MTFPRLSRFRLAFPSDLLSHNVHSIGIRLAQAFHNS